MRIILMGPPGVGKGTEAEHLVKHFNIPHISTGNIFRSLLKTNTKIGKIAKYHIDRGEFVPDDITNKIVEKRLSEKDSENGFLFDGYPRNLEQAIAFDKLLSKKKWKLDAVINIKADDDLIIERIGGRRICPSCGRVYHIENKKPKVAGICDFDNTPLIQRVDDMKETVLKRLNIYNEQTAPVLDYYKKLNVFYEVDGSKGITWTDEQVMKVLGEHK